MVKGGWKVTCRGRVHDNSLFEYHAQNPHTYDARILCPVWAKEMHRATTAEILRVAFNICVAHNRPVKIYMSEPDARDYVHRFTFKVDRVLVDIEKNYLCEYIRQDGRTGCVKFLRPL